jgi:hypothetical protein
MAMTPTLTLDEALRLRLRSQRLHPDFAMTSAHDLAAHLCGLQAQDVKAGTLSFRPRSAGLTAGDVDHARNVDRTIVRMWVMRNTLHFIPAEDVHWLLALLGPKSIRQTQRRREQLGLSEPVVERGIGLIRELLQNGPMPRAALIKNINQHGIPTEGQAGIHLLARAALEGVICYGPDTGKQMTFVLLDQWLRDSPRIQPADPLAGLAGRYLAAYAPSAPEDFARWAGITLSDARAGFAALEDALVAVRVEGEPAWLLESQAGWLDAPDERPVVRLLPNFDTYLLGWRSRDSILPARYADRIHPGGGILHASVMFNGRIVGRWKSVKGKSALTIEVEPFQRLSGAALDMLEDEAENVAQFLDLDGKLNVENP